MIESSIVTYKDYIIDYSRGSTASVEFNFERIWAYKKSLEDSFQPYLLNFYHVHPEGINNYSELDKNCMAGLFIAFGFPIYFAILTFSNTDLFDISPRYSAFEYVKKDIINPVDVEYLTRDQLLFLKFLSYGGVEALQ